MPDKLTDKEILKALECCGALDKGCQKCVYNETFGSICIHFLCKDTLNLINRLQAENGIYETCNARKDEAIKHLESEVKRLQAENERLKPFEDKIAKFNSHIRVEDMLVFASSLEEWLEFCENLKAEAYKECIDMVKKKGINIGVGEIFITTNTLNNLLKELVDE